MSSQHRETQRRRLGRSLALPLLAMVVQIGGCTRPQPAGGAGSTTQPSELSPRGVVERLIALRAAGRYQELQGLVIAEQRRAVADTLLAVDEFLAANRQLGDYLRDHVGLALAERIDQSHLGDNLDIFSRFVELLAEHVDGDAATVAFTIDQRVPVRRTRLRRVAGVWLYDPGAGYSPNLPQAFVSMARGLRRVREEIAAGAIPAAALRDDPDRLVREVRLKLMDGVRLLGPPGSAPSGP